MTRRSIRQEAKAIEREIAALLGGRRLRAGEWRGPGDVDVDGDWWIAQVKHRQLPAWFRHGMRQAVDGAQSLARRPMPLLVVRDKPGVGRTAETYVIVRADHWLAWNGRGE